VSDDLGKNISPSRGSSRRINDSWPAQWFERDCASRLVVGRDLAVLAINAQAKRLIDQTDGLAVRDTHLVMRDRKAASDLSDAVAAATPKARFRVIGNGGGSAMLVEAQALGEEAGAPVALLLRDLGATIEVECADLEPIFGVTPGEHQVILHLLQGHSSREIADRSGKSILTIRTHVKRAYGKIGVVTRGQLFARLLPYLSIR